MAKVARPEMLCAHFEDHTLCPEGYIQWHAWAEEMSRTHRQEKCAGCGLYAIWTPKRPSLIPRNRSHE
jgi:hypothetical protein